MFQTVKLGVKIAVGFGVILFLALAVGFAALWEMREAKEDAVEVTQ